MYRTQQIWIKEGNRLYDYCKLNCQKAKNLYNATNFHIRQLYTALSINKELQPLQEEVLALFETYVPKINDHNLKLYENRLVKERQKPIDKQKEVKLHQFSMPTAENKFVSYEFLDAVFKHSKNGDYYGLPAQVNQQTMKEVYEAWTSFDVAKKDYPRNPHKYTGEPKIPGYVKNAEKTVTFTNQVAVIKDNKFLKLPKTKLVLNIGKLGLISGTLQEVRIKPAYGRYMIELIFDVPEEETVVGETLMGIDLGINNFATIVTNDKNAPVLVKGRVLKSINSYYNKLRAKYYGILRCGKQPKKGEFTTKRLTNLDYKRSRKLKDFFHKTSFNVVKIAEERGVSKIVIGQNVGWKQEVTMRKDVKQNFLFISHGLFSKMLTYKAEAKGIQVEVHEESYTSKASFLDSDEIPTYGKNNPKTKFSGQRIMRGLYRSKNGDQINADVNGAANILRKAVPNAFAQGIKGVVSHPLVLLIR